MLEEPPARAMQELVQAAVTAEVPALGDSATTVVVPAIAVPPHLSNPWAAVLPPMMHVAQAPPTAPAEPAAHTTTRRSTADSDAPAEAEVMAPDTPAVQVPEIHKEQAQDMAEEQWQELSRVAEAAENVEELQQKLQEPSDWIANVGHHACDSHTPYTPYISRSQHALFFAFH